VPHTITLRGEEARLFVIEDQRAWECLPVPRDNFALLQQHAQAM
jgi:hypothetical protein